MQQTQFGNFTGRDLINFINERKLNEVRVKTILNKFEKHVKNSQCKVSEKLPIQNLLSEYKNQSILNNIQQIKEQKFVEMRRIKGDGNCFYRSLGTALIELLAHDTNLIESFSKRVKENINVLLKNERTFLKYLVIELGEIATFNSEMKDAKKKKEEEISSSCASEQMQIDDEKESDFRGEDNNNNNEKTIVKNGEKTEKKENDNATPPQKEDATNKKHSDNKVNDNETKKNNTSIYR